MNRLFPFLEPTPAPGFLVTFFFPYPVADVALGSLTDASRLPVLRVGRPPIDSFEDPLFTP